MAPYQAVELLISQLNDRRKRLEIDGYLSCSKVVQQAVKIDWVQFNRPEPTPADITANISTESASQKLCSYALKPSPDGPAIRTWHIIATEFGK